MNFKTEEEFEVFKESVLLKGFSEDRPDEPGWWVLVDPDRLHSINIIEVWVEHQNEIIPLKEKQPLQKRLRYSDVTGSHGELSDWSWNCLWKGPIKFDHILELKL